MSGSILVGALREAQTALAAVLEAEVCDKDLTLSVAKAEIRARDVLGDHARAKALVDAQTLDDVADVLYFLHNTEPLRGCDYNGDESLIAGRNRIIQWLEGRVRSVGGDALNLSQPSEGVTT
jgi:hypothetical protein